MKERIIHVDSSFVGHGIGGHVSCMSPVKCGIGSLTGTQVESYGNTPIPTATKYVRLNARVFV
jgi:hypothetical protein